MEGKGVKGEEQRETKRETESEGEGREAKPASLGERLKGRNSGWKWKEDMLASENGEGNGWGLFLKGTGQTFTPCISSL